MVAERFIQKLLAGAGVNPERFMLDWASAAQAPLYVELITKFTKRVKELGPLGASDGKPLEEIRKRLLSAKAAVSGVRLRTQFARLTQELRGENDYSPEHLEARIAEKLGETIAKEMRRA